MKKLLLIIGCLVFMGGCSPNTAGKDLREKNIMFSNIELKVPKDLNVRPSAEPNSHQIIDNDFDKNDLDKPAEYRIELWANQEKCMPSLTGTSEPESLLEANGKATWGKLDRTQWSIDKAYPDALCAVPLKDCPQEEYWSGAGCQGLESAYALCSEKDGKTVVICISQMTDNPQLAEDIFKTFRWTK